MNSPVEISKSMFENYDWKSYSQYINLTTTDDYDKMNVKDLLIMNEEKSLYDDMLGWTSGINEVNQRKMYVSANAILFEKHNKKTLYKFKAGHMKCSLIVYYLCQDDDFFDWYKEHDTSYIFTGF